MTTLFVASRHAVEEERVDIVVEGFVIKEEFGQEAEITAPASLASAIYFEEGNAVVTIDFVAWWVEKCAFGAVSFEGLEAVGIAEAKLANVDAIGFCVNLRIWREIPGFHFEGAHLYFR